MMPEGPWQDIAPHFKPMLQNTSCTKHGSDLLSLKLSDENHAVHIRINALKPLNATHVIKPICLAVCEGARSFILSLCYLNIQRKLQLYSGILPSFQSKYP